MSGLLPLLIQALLGQGQRSRPRGLERLLREGQGADPLGPKIPSELERLLREGRGAVPLGPKIPGEDPPLILGGEESPSLPGLPPIQLTPRERRKLEKMPGFVAPPGRSGRRFPANTPPQIVDELYEEALGPQGMRPHMEELLRNQEFEQSLLGELVADPDSPSNRPGLYTTTEPGRERRWLLGKEERARKRAARQEMISEMSGPIPAGDIMVGQRLRQGLPIDPRVQLAGRREETLIPDDPRIWGIRNIFNPGRHSGRQQF